MTTNDKLRVRWEYIILASMYVGYMAFILCRTAIQVSGPAMLEDTALGLTKTHFGQILAWGTAGMVFGKLTTGLIADALGGRKVFLLALSFAAAAAIAMGSAGSYTAFAGANFFMLFCAAAGWPAMASLISAWYPPQKFGRVWGVISTSSRLSSVLSMLFLGFLIGHFSWENIFRIGGAVGLLVAGFIFFSLKARPRDVGLQESSAQAAVTATTASEAHALQGKNIKDALIAFAKSGRFWLICVSLMSTTIMMEFIGFLPIYLRESFGVEPSMAAKASSVFPAGCLLALVGGGFIYDGVSRKGRMGLLGGMLLASSLCIGMLWVLPGLGISPSWKLNLAVATLFTYGITVAPAYYLPMSVFSIEFGGAHCGLLIGLIDATGYFASMLYQYTGGRMVDQGGWGSMLALLFVCSLVAVLSTMCFAYQDYRAQRV